MLLLPNKSIAPWLWIPKPLRFAAPGGYPCCCKKCDCDDALADSYDVQLVDFVTMGAGCANCANYDATYNCTWHGFISNHPAIGTGTGYGWCVFRYNFGSPPCQWDVLDFCIPKYGNVITVPSVVLFDTSGPTDYMRYVEGTTGKCSFSNTLFPFNSGNSECNGKDAGWTSSSARVTSV